jgi:hypothetical protein
MAEALRHPGPILGVARFYHAPRGSMRCILDSRPGEGRLLAYAMGAAAIWILGRIAIALAGAGPGTDVLGLAVANTLSIGFLTLFFYVLATLGTALARVFRGTGSWHDGRAAFVWAALVTSPVLVLSSLAALSMPGAPPAALAALGQVGPVFFAWALAQCYAEAFGFAKAWAVFAVIAGLALAIAGALWWLSP